MKNGYAALLKEESVTGQQYEQVKSELDAMRRVTRR